MRTMWCLRKTSHEMGGLRGVRGVFLYAYGVGVWLCCLPARRLFVWLPMAVGFA